MAAAIPMLSTLPADNVRYVSAFMRSYMKFTTSKVTRNPFYFTNAKLNLEDVKNEGFTEEQRRHLDGKLADADSDREDNYRYPLVLKTMYILLNNPSIAGQIRTGDGGTGMEIFKFEKVMNDYDVHKHIVPIGLTYHGLGWIIVLYMVKRTGKFFFGLNGGSNGFDQTFNHEFYKEFNPNTQFKLHFPDKEMYTFPKALEIFRQKDWLMKICKMMIQMPDDWETSTMKQLREEREGRATARASARVADLVSADVPATPRKRRRDQT